MFFKSPVGSSTTTQTGDLHVHAYDDLLFQKGSVPVLDELDQKLCKGPLTEAECFESLKSMESNKSPGTDGLPVEFYKVFWIHNNIILAESF